MRDLPFFQGPPPIDLWTKNEISFAFSLNAASIFQKDAALSLSILLREGW